MNDSTVASISPEEACSKLPKWLVRLLPELSCDGACRLYRSETRVETGTWMMKKRLYACAGQHFLWLAGNGPQAYVRKVSYDNMLLPAYNHVTGEVVIKVDDGEPVKLKMKPVDGYNLLDLINNRKKESHNA